MISEKKFSPTPEKERKPKIVIRKSSEAPAEIKENPFHDPEFWGMAPTPEDIYLPNSDEAISFAVAAHEIGHLVSGGNRDDARLDNFEATRAEEQRAWNEGWKYLQKYLPEYYQDRPEIVPKIQEAFKRIRDFLMQATDLGKDMYLEQGALDNLSDEEIDQILKERRENFFSERGILFKNIFDEMKKEKIGIKPDWNKFTAIVTKAVENILKDNNKVI